MLQAKGLQDQRESSSLAQELQRVNQERRTPSDLYKNRGRHAPLIEQRSLIYNPSSTLLEEFNSMRFNNSGRLRKLDDGSFVSNDSVVRKLKPTFNPKQRINSEQKTDRDCRSIYSNQSQEVVHQKSSFNKGRERSASQERKTICHGVKLLLSLLQMSRSQDKLEITQRDKDILSIFLGSEDNADNILIELKKVQISMREQRSKLSKEQKLFKDQIDSLRHEMRKLKEENVAKTLQCQSLSQKLHQSSPLKRIKDSEVLKLNIERYAQLFKDSLNAGAFNQRRWSNLADKCREEYKKQVTSKGKQVDSPFRKIDEMIEGVLKSAARDSIRTIGQAESQTKRLEGLKDILERELQFTQRMLVNLQKELHQRGDMMQKLVEALNDPMARYQRQDYESTEIHNPTTDSEAPHSYSLKPYSGIENQYQTEYPKENFPKSKATLRFLQQDGSSLQEREERRKRGSISSIHSTQSQKNLIEQIESSQMEVAHKLTKTVSQIERTLSKVKIHSLSGDSGHKDHQKIRKMNQDQYYKLPKNPTQMEQRENADLPDQLKNCISSVTNKIGPIIEGIDHSKKKRAKKIYRRSNHFNFKSLDLSHTPDQSSKQSTPEFTTRKKEEYEKTPKSTFRTESQGNKAQLKAKEKKPKEFVSKEEKKGHQRTGSTSNIKCPVPSSLLQLELSKVKQKDLQEVQPEVYSRESSISPSPSNSVIKVMKDRRMKSIAEESVTQTITSLCFENSRLKEELFALEERYESEKDDFEKRLRVKDEEGSKSVRALEQQIRHLNSELESIQDQLSGISFTSPRLGIKPGQETVDNYEGIQSSRVTKDEAHSDKPETIYNFSEIEEA